MKKSIKIIHLKVLLAALIIVVFGGSCKKLVEIPTNPPSQITAEQLFADSANVIGAIAGIYNGLVAANYGIGTSLAIYTGMSTDELVTGQYVDEMTAQFLNNSIVVNNPNVNSLWSNCYTKIYQVNACLAGLSTSNAISAGLKRQLTGEIKVVRALYYFNLVNLFGGVPIVLSTEYKTTMSLPRATVNEVYAQIIADLTGAEEILTPTYPSAGRARINMFAAKALLAKVYLYRGEWQSAEALSTQVIDAGIYNLVSEPNSVFLAGSPEAIWQLPANGLVGQTSDAQNFVPYSSGTPPNYPVSANLLSAFEPDDQRLQKWLAFTEADVDGSGTLVKYYYPYKYKNRQLQSATTEAYMVLRLGEQYLIRAEARAQQNNVSGAVADLNLIRKRARANDTALPDHSLDITKEVCLTAVLHERQTELFCEWGNRWFDLKKSGKIDQILGAEKTKWKATAALYPIPLDQMRLNSALIQNLGY